MSGTLAHLTLVDTLCQVDVLNGINTLTPTMKRSLMTFMNFCELGAVSPDYPYLNPLSSNAAAWANIMHYWKPADFIRSGIKHVHNMNYSTTDARHCLAWLFGYTSHVVTDMTVHPVINLKVGPYEQNKTNHRICEMNQDVYIFHEKKTGIDSDEFIRNCGISSCVDPSDKEALDPAISDLWSNILKEIPLETVKMKNDFSNPDEPPEPNEWHKYYVTILDKFALEGKRLPPFSRHFAEGEGLVYPGYDNIIRDYIDNLRRPVNTPIGFDMVFQQAQENVKQVWTELGSALDKGKPELFTLANADLDTGIIDSNYVFWRT